MMSSSMQEQIDWIKSEIESQVDAGIENFTILESGDSKLLEFCQVVVNAIIGKIDVAHALDYFYYLQDNGGLEPSKDRLTALHDYFYAWIELELAKRYA